jgi:hypothetical protein
MIDTRNCTDYRYYADFFGSNHPEFIRNLAVVGAARGGTFYVFGNLDDLIDG